MGNSQSSPNINYEDVQIAIKSPSYVLISTLSHNEQNCLIFNTIPALKEEVLLNEKLKNTNSTEKIIIYGKNCDDSSVARKFNQCSSLGFDTYVYKGGIFEWLLLQDIYGNDEFPTNGKENDILKYKPISKFNTYFITN